MLILLILLQSITISWDANPPEQQVTGYNVYAREAGTDPWITVGSTPETSFTYELPSEAAFELQVTAVNVRAESEPSDVLSVPAAPTAPLGLDVVVLAAVIGFLTLLILYWRRR